MSRAVRIAALIVAAAAYVAVPLVFDDLYLLRVLSYLGLNVIVVIGLALLFGYAGQISMGHAAFVGIGAYVLAYCTVHIGLPWIVAVVAAVIVSAAFGAVLAWPALRLKGHYLAMATLGFGQIALVAMNELKPLTGGPDGMGSIPAARLGSFVFDTHAEWFWLVWAAVGTVGFIAYRIVRGASGLRLMAVRGSEPGASASGIDVASIKVRMFAVSAAFAGLSGALLASIVGFISPSLFSIDHSVRYLVMTVLGGPYSLVGPALSSGALTAMQYAEAFFPGMPEALSSALQALETDLFAIAILAVVLFVPGGIAGALAAMKRRDGR